MVKLTIVANIITKADKIEQLKLIDITRAEEVCSGSNHDLHQDNENPVYFILYENRGSRDLWQTHMSNQLLKDNMVATEGTVEAFILNEMTQTA